jgi:hypothetical protein
MPTFGTTVRNNACNAYVDSIDAGSAGGKLKIKDGSTLLVTITYETTAFGAAGTPGAGQATAASFPKTGTAVASGDADGYEITDSDDNVLWSSATLGGLSLDNTNIASGQDVTVNSHVFTVPAS